MTPSTVTSSVAKTATAEVLQAPSEFVYVELADRPVLERDSLSQLRANLEQLEDMYNRFGFMVREISYLTKGR